jgi:hypothetical protein
MPLVPCPDCGRQVSTAAVSCPQCGRPNPAEHTSQTPGSSEIPSQSPRPGERTSKPASPELSTVAQQPRSAPSTDDPPSDLTKLMGWVGAFFALVLIIGMCSQSGSVTPSAPNVADTTLLSTASYVPTLSAEDSARFKQRAREIVQEHKPADWPEADRSRMIALADTVVFFGDTADAAIRNWLAAKRRADEARIRAEAAAAERRVDAAKWRYVSDTDPMASRPSRTASIDSENTVEFDFPYGGQQHATLTLRDHPTYGRDVIVRIREGQILCPSYDDCSIRVRFDDGPAERWTAAGPADNSTTLVFIRNYSRFLQRMRNAKVVRIQIPVYQEGAPAFEFRVGGFDQDRYANGS